MKKTITTKYTALALSAAFVFGGVSCSDFTEIDAKGNNLLGSVSDLELLLNQDYDLSVTDMMEVEGGLIRSYSPLAADLYQTPKTKFSILCTWDEQAHDEMLPDLTSGDDFYTNCYNYIGRVANPILQKIDGASGDGFRKPEIKAEAYVVRAFFHLLLAQKFAPAYDKATAATILGPAYRTEDMAASDISEPLSLEAYYKNILSDIDAALALNALPSQPANQLRFGLASAYAVKALALMALQDFPAASDAAGKALAVNGNIADYNALAAETGTILRPKLQCPEDYFAPYELNFYTTYTKDSVIEPGNAVVDKVMNMNLMYEMMGMPGMDYSVIMLGVPGLRMTFDLDSSWPSFGLRSTQMYLIQAEALLHAGKIDDAMDILDKIRVNRINPAAYTPLKGAVSKMEDAIAKVKSTAYGENIYTLWAFVDAKRWNRLEGWKETQKRNLCGIDMEITPDSHMWVFPIPKNVLGLNPNFKAYLNW